MSREFEDFYRAKKEKKGGISPSPTSVSESEKMSYCRARTEPSVAASVASGRE
jgi:hypothetical protein